MNYLKWNWPHIALNNSREIPRYILFLNLIFFIFKFFIMPLIFIFKRYNYLAETRPYV